VDYREEEDAGIQDVEIHQDEEEEEDREDGGREDRELKVKEDDVLV